MPPDSVDGPANTPHFIQYTNGVGFYRKFLEPPRHFGFSKFCSIFAAEMRACLTSAGLLLFRYSLVFILSDSHCPKFSASANSNNPSFIQCAIFEVVRGCMLRMLFTTIFPCRLLVSIATTKFLPSCTNSVRMTLLPMCVALRNTAIGFCIAFGKSRISRK